MCDMTIPVRFSKNTHSDPLSFFEYAEFGSQTDNEVVVFDKFIIVKILTYSSLDKKIPKIL